MALHNGGEHDPDLQTARLEMAAEWLRRFPSEDGLITGNFRRALADSYFETGRRRAWSLARASGTQDGFGRAAMRRIRSMMAADGVTLPGPAGAGCSTTIGCHASEPDEP